MGACTSDELLAGGGILVSCIRLHPRRESGRIEDWHGGGGVDWFLFMPDAASPGRLVVGCRLSHGAGLGRELSLPRPGQRRSFARTPDQPQLSRSRLANRRLSRSGGKLPRFRRDRSALGSV